MDLDITNDFQQKIMTQTFTTATTLATEAEIAHWREAWMGALKSWHSPYKALIDCRNLSIGDSAEVSAALQRMLRFFSGFFLKKAIGFGFDEGKGHARLPFPVLADEDAAAQELGIRAPRRSAEPLDFRATIQLQNHFNQHVVELSFAAPVKLDAAAQIATLKSKLTNNLMQWHSKWSLLIDCTNLEGVDPTQREAWESMERFFKGFFLKTIIGYSAKSPKDSYPFTVYRARHAAAGRLEGEGNFAGDEANCKSRKTVP